MTFRNPVTAVTVPLSGFVTEEINIGGYGAIGVIAPVVTSCQAFLQVAAGPSSPVSASYVRLRDMTVNSVVAWSIGPGSEAAAFAYVAPFQFARVEFSIAQSSARSLQVIGERS